MSITKQNMASGVGFVLPDPLPDPWVDPADRVPPEEGPTRFFQIPWAKLGYLKRIEIGRGCNGASGCFTFQIWDDFVDDMQAALPGVEITDVSGLVKRKDITIPLGTEQINWDETEDIPLLGTIYGVPSISGVSCTLTARTM